MPANLPEFVQWGLKALFQWNDFQSRARRKEYWYFVLCYLIVFVVLEIVATILRSVPVLGLLIALVILLFSLVMLVPSIAVGIRRLHDTGRSGWWMLLGLVPLGGLVLLVFFCLEGVQSANQYGPDPKLAGVPDMSGALKIG